ncbi:hypothetical protein BRC81_11795 [Halobacteriales archaeon QS_1_68_20]|nr:MAG: hypothetical protein BRC81_11795 [Halobacteriales archaeon QS_1_68_20]
MFGTAESVDPDTNTVTVSVEADEGTFSGRAEGVETDVEPGGTVQVYGTVQSGHVVAVEGFAVVTRSPRERLSKYGFPLVGALLALGAFFRYREVDRAPLTFEPR